MVSSESASSDLAPWLLAYVAEQAKLAQVSAWVDRVSGAILTEIPEVGEIEGLGESIRVTVRDHWMAFLADLPKPEQHFRLVDSAHRLAADVADRQVPLEILIRFYRVAQQEVWGYAREVIAEAPSGEVDHAELLIYFWNRAGVWLDSSITASIDVYQAVRSRVLAGAAAQRYESVRAVLAGELDDPREASSALGGYPISVHHTAFVLSVTDPERAGSLEPLALDLARQIGAANPLVVKPGGRQLWMWLGTRDAPDLTPLSAPSAPSDLAHESIAVGIGSSTTGIAGFAASHREALGALRVATPDGPTWLTLYTDVELPVLLGCTPDVDRFVARQLGPLTGEDEGTQRIRETLSAYLDCGGSAEEASRLLVVHRNTIRYRLGQAEEMLGRPVAKLSPQLSIALRHHELFHR
ncbi:helix-turn-helix domain-containing protein [Nocardioides sp. WS12]|uniref:PucR family transcriptional regulator n=1 Tax=Nocardioides sp. WS12 TaxID=2486272 RepID=UPI0015FD8ECF|nr:helix-turn-helix domain-containing protein [Nocardioides sp. WS12]